MKDSVIPYFEKNGWQQSHTATAKGCVFEKMHDNELTIIAVDKYGTQLGKITLCGNSLPVAGAIVEGYYNEINK